MKCKDYKYWSRETLDRARIHARRLMEKLYPDIKWDWPKLKTQRDRNKRRMSTYYGRAKYRFNETPPIPPPNETPEERILRMLNTPVKTIKDNKAFLAALRATVKAEEEI